MRCWPTLLFWLIVATLGCGQMLAACGQKGPLILPDKATQQQPQPR